MVDVAAVQAKFDAAFTSGLAGVAFAITYQSPRVDYDAIAGGPAANTNPVLTGRCFIPEQSREEIDGESNKVSTLNMIIMRNWLSAEPELGAIVDVQTGVYAGEWRIDSEPQSTVVHWELRLVR